MQDLKVKKYRSYLPFVIAEAPSFHQILPTRVFSILTKKALDQKGFLFNDQTALHAVCCIRRPCELNLGGGLVLQCLPLSRQ